MTKIVQGDITTLDIEVIFRCFPGYDKRICKELTKKGESTNA